MSSEEQTTEKDFDQIDAELGEDHYLRLIQLLAVDAPGSKEGLLQLHHECRRVFSKFPTEDQAKNKTVSKRALSHGRSFERATTAPLRPTPPVQKPRIMLTKRAPSLGGIGSHTPKKIVT